MTQPSERSLCGHVDLSPRGMTAWQPPYGVAGTVQNKATTEIRKTCDMGRGGGSGKWAEVGTFRAPPLRGLAARAPYFHDGQAETLMDCADARRRSLPRSARARLSTRPLP